MKNIRYWIDLVEARRKKPDEFARQEAQWRAEDTAASAEAAMIAKYKGSFTALEDAAKKVPNQALRHSIEDALSAALENANETEGVKLESGDYWRVALDSICQTSSFNEHRRISQWFERHGYTW